MGDFRGESSKWDSNQNGTRSVESWASVAVVMGKSLQVINMGAYRRVETEAFAAVVEPEVQSQGGVPTPLFEVCLTADSK